MVLLLLLLLYTYIPESTSVKSTARAVLKTFLCLIQSYLFLAPTALYLYNQNFIHLKISLQPADYGLNLEALKAIKLPVTFKIKWLGNEVLNLIFEQITFSTVPKLAFLFRDYILQAFSFVGQLFRACQAVVFHCFPLFCLFPNWRQPLVIIARLCAIDYKDVTIANGG